LADVSRLLGLGASAVLILLAGCGNGTPTPAATSTAPAPESTTSVAQVSQAPSSARPTTTRPKGDPAGVCPDGRYVLRRFSGTSLGAMRLTGTGNDLKATFADGAYLMRAAGRSPYTVVTGAGQQAKLTLKGTMHGTYTGVGDTVSFTAVGAQGTAKLVADGQTQTLPMTQLTKTLAPSGRVSTTCTGDRMTITMKTITLELRH
jgi:hypothetical protein